MNTYRSPIMSIVVTLSCLVVTAVWAQSKPMQDKQKAEAAAKAAPSGGGSPFTSDCGNDGVMVGIRANTGSLVDSVQAVCAKVDSNGAWAGGQFSGARAGGSGGGPANLMCDDGWAVTAVFGKSGSLVDSIGVRCGKLGASGDMAKIVSGSASRGPAGGSGGSAFDRPCSGGQIAKGISGRAGTLVDQISSVACHNPTVQIASGEAAPIMSGRIDRGGAGSIISTTGPILVEAQSLTITPARPKAGDQVTVKFTIKNTGTGTVAKVPWAIHLATGDRTLGHGEQANVAPGATFDVTAMWTATAGDQLLQGYVDASGKILSNNTAQRIARLALNVPLLSASTKGSAPLTYQRVLNYQAAKNAGATFANNIETGHTCSVNRVLDPMDGTVYQEGYSVAFHIFCALVTGGSATPEAFGGPFRLLNGWKIVSFTPLKEIRKVGADWQWISAPQVGSNNLYMRMSISAGGGLVLKGSELLLLVKVVIEGPEGTCPYNNIPFGPGWDCPW